MTPGIPIGSKLQNLPQEVKEVDATFMTHCYFLDTLIDECVKCTNNLLLNIFQPEHASMAPEHASFTSWSSSIIWITSNAWQEKSPFASWMGFGQFIPFVRRWEGIVLLTIYKLTGQCAKKNILASSAGSTELVLVIQKCASGCLRPRMYFWITRTNSVLPAREA